MANSNKKSQAGDKGTGANDTAESKPEKKKEERMALSHGILWPVERSFYDANQNCVIDVIRVEKFVQNKKGEEVPITIYREEYCKDEAIQEKYRRKPDSRIEIVDV